MTDRIAGFELLEPDQKKVAQKASEAGYKVTVSSVAKVTFVHLHVPTVRGRPQVLPISPRLANAYLEIEFSRYVKLGDYVALFDKEDRTVDVAFSESSQNWIYFYFTEEFVPFGRHIGDGAVGTGRNFSSKKFAIVEEPNILTMLARRRNGKPGVASLRINVDTSDADEAYEQLEMLGPAFCFEFDCKFGVGLQVARSRERVDAGLNDEYDHDYSDIDAPRNQYDFEALSLYLEGRDSSAPLSQYLLYYQVLEYYLSHAVQDGAMESVGRILRDPKYSYGSSKQVRAIVASAQNLSNNLKELEQLKVLLPLVVDRPQLIEHMSHLKVAKEALESRKQAVRAVFPVRFSPDNAKLLDDIATRVYTIRNRIVHSKSSDVFRDVSPLWPTSREASALGADIALIRYLAQRTLVRYGTPLNVEK